jgi:hypothetical protein
MLRTMLTGICLLLLLVSMSGCLIGWEHDGRGRSGGGHDGHDSGGHDGGGRHDDRR